MRDLFKKHIVHVIDSHTGGEPTRVVIAGGPDLGSDSLAERRNRFRDHFDDFRSAVINEPRGSDVLVGALLCEPVDPLAVAGVIYFNNVGPLWMCGHATIGLAVTLGHLGRIQAGTHRLETPVGTVLFEYDGANRVVFDNVPSYRFTQGITIDVEEVGPVTGDVAWGGNWFFLVDFASLPGLTSQLPGVSVPFRLPEVDVLTQSAQRIRRALRENGITGAEGGEIDHIEFIGPPVDPQNHGRNFVLCPGAAYDRSPCGTGTSAKLACLAADRKLMPGEVWRQESILGSVFEGTFRYENGRIIPRIAGTAYITAEANLILDPADPFQMGITPERCSS
ncbi:proline racemase family protein [Schlesneria sp.]|uniref:proline racemase family protein n=1 Tax=Schlesneria sp. TaxID=2762018 RepID=UPI002EFB9A3B